MMVLDEADILPYSIAFLHAQGAEVHVIDGWSTDGSWEALPSLGVKSRERFPADGQSKEFVYSEMLSHLEDLAENSGADWCYLNDADEFRLSPRPGETMRQGLERVASEGYNVIDHHVYAFFPTDDGYMGGDPQRYIRYFDETEDMLCKSHIPQQKCWRNIGRVSLEAGGHRAEILGKLVYPEKFVMKHYPFRTNAQAAGRIRTRLERRCKAEHKERKWGVHYDSLIGQQEFTRDPSTLQFWRDTDYPRP